MTNGSVSMDVCGGRILREALNSRGKLARGIQIASSRHVTSLWLLTFTKARVEMD